MRTPWPLIAVALLLVGCGAPRSNLLVVVSDAFRADALECDGETSTPNLCGLAASGVTFERAYATAPWTLPSTVAMMTGNSPSLYHLTVEDREIAPELQNRIYRIPEAERPLGELLVGAGYRVEAVVENPVVMRGGAMRGFTRRSVGGEHRKRLLAGLDPRLGFRPRDARYLAMVGALGLLSSPPDGPLALLYWIDDPHAEYRPPRELLDREPRNGLPRELEFYLGLGHRDSPKRGRRKLRDHVDSMTPEELAFVERLYRLEVESVDQRVGYLLRALELSGRADSTLVAFTSDHGEAFGEHGDYLHGVSLYDELVRVPLILAGPGLPAGRRISTPVSHVDLAPTIMDLLDLPGLGDTQGESLRERLEGDRGAEPRPLYLSSPDRLDRVALVLGNHKLIATRDHGMPTLELYDLAGDPGETVNLVDELPDVRRDLEARLERAYRQNERLRRARVAAQARVLVDETLEETERALRSVGYID